jgi:pimeloyl-ACP methyl ester carboxylesterase
MSTQIPFVGDLPVEQNLFFQICFYVVAIWFALEIGFLTVMQFFVLPRLQKLTKPQVYHGDAVQHMKRILNLVDTIQCINFETYISGFFRGAKWEDVHRDNFRSFLAWAMFGKHLVDLTQQDFADVAEVIEYAASMHPSMLKLKPGYNHNVKHCAMTLEPIEMIHRPLFLYVLFSLKDFFTNVFILRACGFQFLEMGNTSYWYRHHGGEVSEGNEPLLVLHGVSTGWGFYLDLATSLGKNRSVVMIDLHGVKIMSLNFTMPTPQQYCDDVTRILNRHNIDKVSMIGHSYGSITACWMVNNAADRISHITLIDPVSMLLSFPEVAINFLYREPNSVMEWLIHLVAAREVTISHTLRRSFWWYNNNLWLEDVPAHIGVVVGLATGDEIINFTAVKEYVQMCRTKRIAMRENNETAMVSSGSASLRARTSRQALATASSFTSLDRMGQAAEAAAMAMEKKDVAMIEYVVWDGFSHGQILMASPEQTHLVATVRSNEKAALAYSK